MNRTKVFTYILLLFVVGWVTSAKSQQTTLNYESDPRGLKDYYNDYFPIGVAVSQRNLGGSEAVLIKKQFNSITAENDMKMEMMQPVEGKFVWKNADSIINFALENNIKVRGHNLCWHEQVPDWFFIDKNGKQVSKTVLLQRLKTHIETVVGRYKGKIYAWDVVNEAIDDDSTKYLRNSKWYQICGEDFIKKAFEYAHAADPSAKLYYNDYNTERPEKRERIFKLLKSLKDQSVPIDGVGLQAHWSIQEPTESELVSAIEKYASLGLKIQFTELDLSIYPWEKDKRAKRQEESDVFSPELESQQVEKYKMVFDVFRRYKNVITNVTFWNISDRRTWLDSYPVAGRKNYPLLFDTELKPKKAYWEVINFAAAKNSKYLSKPLISEIYTADPSAHVFNDKIYIYPSHDIEAGTPENDNGDHFDMRDYHIMSMDSIGGKVTDHGIAFSVKDIPWAGRQLWAPDATYKNGTYYLYFPVKDKADVFRIGVATSKQPTGPFKAQSTPIKGSYSIDPAVFTDTDGISYMYFGGIWGGQLQRWSTGKYEPNGSKTDSQKENEPALSAKVVRMKSNMLSFDGEVKDVKILDNTGKQLLTSDHDRRFFEGAWMHKYNNKYYFSYSTGDTHYLAYAIGDTPLGPFTYQGTFMSPVQGWTTHHSILEIKGKWYIFYHDTELSGKTHLRNVKVTQLNYNADGTIQLIEPIIK